MGSLAALVRRTERLKEQVERLRQEFAELREELLSLESETGGSQTTAAAAGNDCLVLAMQLARGLGPEFCSQQPHDLAERGEDWFAKP